MDSQVETNIEQVIRPLQHQIQEYQRWFYTLDKQLKTLELERQKFSAVVNHTDAGFLVVDTLLQVEWANHVICERFGIGSTAYSLRGSTCNQVLCGRESICESCPALKPFHSSTVAHHEMSLEIDGEVRNIYATAMPIKSPEGEIREVILMLQDVTDLEVLRRSQVALKASEERFRSIFEKAAASMTTIGPDGRFLQVNTNLCEFLGYSEAELLTLTLDDLVPASALEEILRHQNGAKAKPSEVVDLENQYLRKDGSTVWGHSTAVWLLDADGRPTYSILLIQDITKRRRAEALLAGEKRVLEMIARGDSLGAALEALIGIIEEQSPELICSILLADPNGRQLRHGAAPSLSESYNQAADGIEIGPCAGSCGTAAYRKEPVIVSDISSDPLWADYHSLGLEHGLKACWSIPILSTHGSLLGTFAMYYREPRRPDARDWELIERATHLAGIVLERKRAERALQEKTEQLQAIADAMTAFLQSGNWREASTQFLRAAVSQTESEYGFVGVVVEGPVLRILAHEGIVWNDCVSREFYENALKTYREAGYLEFANFNNLFGQVITTAKPVISNDPGSDPRAGGLPPGHPPLRHFLGVPILRENEVVGLIGLANRQGGYTIAEQTKLEILANTAGVLYDSYRRVEREAELEEQLRQSQKMEAVGKLAGGVAHDFNNLLTVITGYSEFLLDGLSEDSPLRRDAAEIKRAGDHAASLTHQLLAFSRKQVLQSEVLDLNVVATEMEKMLGRIIGEDMELVTILEPSIGRVVADRRQIGQVMMNLAVNARDAMPEGGTLTIETSNVQIDRASASRCVGIEPGSYVLLAVSDTGCGMDANTQAHIFEPFFTTKEVGKGSGLGLSTVYGIVQQSGGYICVSSEPGRGSRFTVYLPRVDTILEARVPHDPLAGSTRSSETILLVEDEPMVQELASRILTASGYTVLEATNGIDGLSLCERYEGPIDLVVTDVVMPQMGGQELVRHIALRRPNIKVLYVSGYTGTTDVPNAGSGTGTTYLQKPFTACTLSQKVRETLDR